MLLRSGYFILATMMEITRMNQTCPHCQALVILPELVRNYGDMPIQCHDCENSFFLPAEQLSKIMGGVERRRGRISIRTSVFDYAQSGIGADSNNGDRYF